MGLIENMNPGKYKLMNEWRRGGGSSSLLRKPSNAEGMMELENLHLPTIMEVADARGSHQRMLRLVFGGLTREDIAVISEHLPMKFWSIVKRGKVILRWGNLRDTNLTRWSRLPSPKARQGSTDAPWYTALKRTEHGFCHVPTEKAVWVQGT